MLSALPYLVIAGVVAVVIKSVADVTITLCSVYR